jgi:hypothetical protein
VFIRYCVWSVLGKGFIGEWWSGRGRNLGSIGGGGMFKNMLISSSMKKTNNTSKKKVIANNNSNSLILIKTNQQEKIKKILEKEKVSYEIYSSETNLKAKSVPKRDIKELVNSLDRARIKYLVINNK